jgi:hypothetical protein
MECIIVLVIIIIGVIYLNETVVGKIWWCEKCNSWSKMKFKPGQINGYVCLNCNWLNQGGVLGSCPTCGWHEKYENRTVSHQGPFRKIDRTDINLFYGVQTEHWIYEEKINCPKHGVFTALIPVDVYERSGRNNNNYDEMDYMNYDYDDDDDEQQHHHAESTSSHIQVKQTIETTAFNKEYIHMKFAAFDLEIAKDFPENSNWQDFSPLGITCAAVAFSDGTEPVFWKGIPQLNQMECQKIVWKLHEFVNSGYTLVTWNGCGFDFSVLGEESGLIKECGELALQHVDLMLIVTFTKGWFLSLQAALLGAGLQGKRKSVVLSNGSTHDDMSGSKAPKLWKDGEYNAVLSYLRDDVVELINLINIISRSRKSHMSVPRNDISEIE